MTITVAPPPKIDTAALFAYPRALIRAAPRLLDNDART
jgi:hypothetical protein